MYKNNKLLTKHHVNEEHYQQLFDSLAILTIEDERFHPHLKQKLKGRYAQGFPVITDPGEANAKCWFINSGMVLAMHHDYNKQVAAYMIFKAGEIAILPDNFINQKDSPPFLMACPDTELLEIRHTDMQKIYELFPKTMLLQSMIISSLFEKYRQKDLLVRIGGKEMVNEFYHQYEDLKGPEPKVIVPKNIQSSFLNINPGSLSRLLKAIAKIEKDNTQDSGKL